jgi:IS30 family transposase
LREELKHFRTKRMFRQDQSHKVDSRAQIVAAISLHERTIEMEDSVLSGHWEGNLIIGSNNSAIATGVERHARFTL